MERMTAAELVELKQVRALAASGVARTVRTGARLSLTEVARSCGTHPSTVLRWERGEQVPHGRIAIAYGRLLMRLLEQ